MTTQSVSVDRPRTRASVQWWTLTSRGLAAMIRNGEIIFAFVAAYETGLVRVGD